MSKNIILVKAISDSNAKDPYSICFESAGYSVFMLQPIDFEFCNASELASCILNPNNYSGLILTSPRSVLSLKNCENISEWKQKKNFAVGDATYHEARGLKLNISGEESGNALNLCEFIKKDTYDKPLLYPKSNLATDVIERSLTSADIAVHSLETYRTITNPNLEQDIRKLKPFFPANMIFFSPSGVNNVLPWLKDDDLQFFAIGATTAKALEDSNLKVTGTASKPSPNSLLQTVQTCST